MAKVILPWSYQTNRGRTRVASLERLVNLFPAATQNISTTKGAQTFVLLGAAGGRPFSDLGDNTEVNQLYSLNDRLFAWSREGFYEIQDNGHSTLLLGRKFGRDISVSDGVIYSDAGFRRNQLWFSDRGEVFLYDLQENVVNEISDPDLRRTGNVAHISNYAIFRNSDSDQFQYSDIADFDSINALSFSTAGTNSDKNVHVEAFEGDLLFFGERTLEVWRLTGNQDSPFAPLSNASLEIGCANGRTVKKLTRDIYWVSDDLRVYRTAARSYQAVPISLHQGVEHDLYKHGASNAFAYAVTMEGHSFYHLVIPEAKRTWVYDETTQLWHERSTFTNCTLASVSCDNGGYGNHIGNSGVMHKGRAYIGGKGHVYEYDLDYGRDGFQPIMREAATEPLDANWDGGITNSVSLEFQNACDQPGELNEIVLQYSDDQGKKWKGCTPRALIKGDNYCPTWRDLGRFRRRSYRWRTFYDGQIVFRQSLFDVEGLGDGRR